MVRIITLLMILTSLSASAKTYKLLFSLDKKTGHLESLTVKGTKMNWVIPANGSLYPWINEDNAWGTIKVDIPQSKNKIAIDAAIKHTTSGYNVKEEITIQNRSSVPIDLSQLRICMPWNARYLDIDTAQNIRCSVDVFLKSEGSNVTCFKATRISQQAPHVGLAVVKGDISNYTTGDCSNIVDYVNGNNTSTTDCAMMYVIPEKVMLPPNKKYTIEWHFFPYEDDKDFVEHVEFITGERPLLTSPKGRNL